jgi:aconitase A
MEALRTFTIRAPRDDPDVSLYQRRSLRCGQGDGVPSRPGNGISHYVHLERFARPGELLVGVELRGTLPEWVQSKDIILELLRRYGVRGGMGRVFEFTGEGVETLSVTERAPFAT